MERAVDQRTIERAMDGASDGSANNRRSDGWCEYCPKDRILEQQKVLMTEKLLDRLMEQLLYRLL